MARKEEKTSLCGILMVLAAIAVGVAGIVYALSTHRRHINREKWKDYDECGWYKRQISMKNGITFHRKYPYIRMRKI